MMTPRHFVIDDFLTAELHDRLLGHVLAHRDLFIAAEVKRHGAPVYHQQRKAMTNEYLGVLAKPFREAVRAVLPAMFEALGMAPFEPARLELELSAHGDGDFFAPHRDTFIGPNAAGLPSDRAITAVYYFHARPRRFTGGQFAVHPFGPGEPELIEPLDNRLLAIPAFAVHEVRPIVDPGGTFESARFAVNAWVHKAR